MDQADIDQVFSDPVTQQVLRDVALARVAYTAPDGSPRVIPIGYVVDGSRIVICTVPKAPKVAALQKDPRVAITIDSNTQPPKALFVRGTAEVEVVDGVPEEYLDASRAGILARDWPDFETGVRALYDAMARITITATWAKILDFETRLPEPVAALIRSRGLG